MSVALQVLMLVVGLVVAVGGIGIALALRLSARQRQRRRPARMASVPMRARAVAPSATASSTQMARARAAAAAEARVRPTPSKPDPDAAHKAKLAALQAMLALGDAKAEKAAESGPPTFADTQPVSDYPTTQFVDRPTTQPSLLDLDIAKSRPADRSRR